MSGRDVSRSSTKSRNVFASGMAAISTTLLALCRPGDQVAYTVPVYGGTAELGDDERPLPNWLGITTNQRVGSSARPGPIIHSMSV